MLSRSSGSAAVFSADSCIGTWAGRKDNLYLDSAKLVSNIAHISLIPPVCHCENLCQEVQSKELGHITAK